MFYKMFDRSGEHVYGRKAVTIHKATVHGPDAVYGPVLECVAEWAFAPFSTKVEPGPVKAKLNARADRRNRKPCSCQQLPQRQELSSKPDLNTRMAHSSLLSVAASMESPHSLHSTLPAGRKAGL